MVVSLRKARDAIDRIVGDATQLGDVDLVLDAIIDESIAAFVRNRHAVFRRQTPPGGGSQALNMIYEGLKRKDPLPVHLTTGQRRIGHLLRSYTTLRKWCKEGDRPQSEAMLKYGESLAVLDHAFDQRSRDRLHPGEGTPQLDHAAGSELGLRLFLTDTCVSLLVQWESKSLKELLYMPWFVKVASPRLRVMVEEHISACDQLSQATLSFQDRIRGVEITLANPRAAQREQGPDASTTVRHHDAETSNGGGYDGSARTCDSGGLGGGASGHLETIAARDPTNFTIPLRATSLQDLMDYETTRASRTAALIALKGSANEFIGTNCDAWRSIPAPVQKVHVTKYLEGVRDVACDLTDRLDLAVVLEQLITAEEDPIRRAVSEFIEVTRGLVELTRRQFRPANLVTLFDLWYNAGDEMAAPMDGIAISAWDRGNVDRFLSLIWCASDLAQCSRDSTAVIAVQSASLAAAAELAFFYAGPARLQWSKLDRSGADIVISCCLHSLVHSLEPASPDTKLCATLGHLMDMLMVTHYTETPNALKRFLASHGRTWPVFADAPPPQQASRARAPFPLTSVTKDALPPIEEVLAEVQGFVRSTALWDALPKKQKRAVFIRIAVQTNLPAPDTEPQLVRTLLALARRLYQHWVGDDLTEELRTAFIMDWEHQQADVIQSSCVITNHPRMSAVTDEYMMRNAIFALRRQCQGLSGSSAWNDITLSVQTGDHIDDEELLDFTADELESSLSRVTLASPTMVNVPEKLSRQKVKGFGRRRGNGDSNGDGHVSDLPNGVYGVQRQRLSPEESDMFWSEVNTHICVLYHEYGEGMWQEITDIVNLRYQLTMPVSTVKVRAQRNRPKFTSLAAEYSPASLRCPWEAVGWGECSWRGSGREAAIHARLPHVELRNGLPCPLGCEELFPTYYLAASHKDCPRAIESRKDRSADHKQYCRWTDAAGQPCIAGPFESDRQMTRHEDDMHRAVGPGPTCHRCRRFFLDEYHRAFHTARECNV